MHITPRTRLELEDLLAGLLRGARRHAPLLLGLGGLEVLGRTSPVDGVDFFGVALLIMLVWAVLTLHKSNLDAWWATRGPARLGRLAGPFWLKWGVDLRGTPALPRRVPPAYAAILVAVPLAAALMFLAREAFPTRARSTLQGISGVALIVYTALLWSALLALGVLAAQVTRSLVLVRLRSAPERLRHAAALVFLVCATAGLHLKPDLLVAVIVAAGLARATLSLWIGARLNILWRRHDAPANTPAAWSDWRFWDAAANLTIAALAVCLVVASGGDRIAGPSHSTTALTALVGHVTAWLAALAGLALVFIEGIELVLIRRADPSRPVPGELVVEGRITPSARERLASYGFRVRAHPHELGPRRPCEVRIDVRADAVPLDLDPYAPPRSWPLVIPPVDLESPILCDRLKRRDMRQRRRALLRGLESAFKQAAGAATEGGQGYWVAPHLWFVPCLLREGVTGEAARVAAPYRVLIPQAARSHFADVMRALELDSIFLEDGVGIRRFKRVLRMLFDYYDMLGGQRLHEGRSLGTVPGVRVLVHEIDLEERFTLTGYPEPDSAELGRARILHVFRDRGRGDEPVQSPVDADSTPSPMLLPA